jgi:hypothetical protein
MTTTIKITALTDIGANLAGTTLVPVVNMAGTPTTERANVNNIANYVLNKATGANLGPVANVKITGGTAGQVLTTNGSNVLSWTTVSSGNSTYGNSNVAAYLPTYTGNISGNVIIANLFSGNGSSLSAIVGANVSGFVPNANVANTAFSVAGANVSGFVPNANVANTAFSVAGANVSGTVGNANLSQYLEVSDVNNNFSYHIVLSAGSGDKSLHIDADDNLQYNPADGTLTAVRVDATYVLADLQYSNGYPLANVTGAGNIATINLTGSTSNVLYGNGVFAPITVGNLSRISNGNSNVTLTDINGNVYINTNGGTQRQWIFDTAGNLRTPGNVDIYGAINFPQQVSSINWSTYNIELSQYGRINTNVDFFANANTIGALYLKGDGSNISNIAVANVVGLGNIATANLTGSNSNVLYGNGVFAPAAGGANTGNVTFSNQIVLGTGSNDGSGGLYLAPGNASIANSAVQYLRVRGGDNLTHIHLDTGNNQAYDQYFGDDAKYVKLELGDAGNVVVGTDDAAGNSYNWTFGSDGRLTFPGTPRIDTSTNNFEVQAAEAINFEANTVVNIYTDAGNNAFQWQFGDDGVLAVPGNLVYVGASPAPYISGFNSVSAEEFTNDTSNVTINANSHTWNFDSTGNLTIPSTSGGFIKTSSNASIGIAAIDNGTNNPAQLLSINAGSGAATSIVSAYSTNVAIQTNAAGTIRTWAFDSAGNLTLPANTFAINYANGTQVSLGGGSNIANGNSNVSIATANGNVTISAVGNTTMTVTGTGANVTGTLTSTGKIGYASGSTVTQTTNRGNGVTINTLAGTIITVSASMTTGEIGAFPVTNNQVDANNDIVLAQVVSPNLGSYNVIANPNSGIGGFYLTLQNISGFPISAEAVTIRFMVIKAPNA